GQVEVGRAGVGEADEDGVVKGRDLCVPTLWHGASGVDAQSRVQSSSVADSSGMGFGTVVADLSQGVQEGSGVATDSGDHRSRAVGAEGSCKNPAWRLLAAKIEW
ncbi:1276_t:CDS:2, partial [Racocetra persica]